ncbi:uncharacterized protein LOC111007025 isoform X3 [Momordica charantia]|uniref:Uncharacterized protein LOC111007025 isoform X3 n=1 Tax=Momordica charantia TaxID=3673 RepID=A0A6J1BYY8_MOMCH|nr:uncharacterized protein LOC111007025 isoform X3 [Momordica charantia]
MAKRIVNGGATVTVKKTIMKRRKKKTIHKVVDYLISDSYLFAPLISSNPPFNYSRSTPKGIEFRERRKDNRSLVKKIEDYLKSDCYMHLSQRLDCSILECTQFWILLQLLL